MLVEWSQVREIAERPLEVVTQDLLEFRLAIVFPVCPFCPVREALVQARSFPLQQPLICRVADEDVLEAVHACLSRARTHELFDDERCEVDVELRQDRLGHELADGLFVEHEADDGGGLQDGPLPSLRRKNPIGRSRAW